MKKLILSLLVILCVLPLFAETIYNIDTNYGKEQVVIPDGYTEKDVLLIIAKNYYELNHDFNLTLDSLKTTTEKVNLYVEENKQLRTKYDDLIKDYDVLTKKLQTMNSLGAFKGTIGVQANKSLKDNTISFGVNGGLILFNKVILNVSFSYPYSLGLSFNCVL